MKFSQTTLLTALLPGSFLMVDAKGLRAKDKLPPGHDRFLAEASGGCPFAASFVENGAAPMYVAQNDNFAEVSCQENDKNCDIPGAGNQGLQTKIDEPCLEDVEPEGLTCLEVATSWTEQCSDDNNSLLSDGFTCGCMSDSVQSGDCK